MQPVGATTFDADVEVDTSDGDVAVVGPFPTGRFNDANGFVQLTYDNEAGLTIAVVRLP